MDVTGQATIFRNEHDGANGTWYTYSTGVSNKRQDGSYVNAYLDVRFRKNVVVENRTRIDIKKGFLTVREFEFNGEKRKKIELMVMEFEVIESDEVYADEYTPNGFSALSDDDVPF